MEEGHNVVPHVRVAAGRVTMLEMEYEWKGVRGTVPQISMDLVADLSHEVVCLAAVYQNAAGDRQVVTDSRTVRPGQTAVESSADFILDSQGWERCFMAFQVFIPPGLTGPVEDENSFTQVFEFVPRSADA
jgi:hypothetical protein